MTADATLIAIVAIVLMVVSGLRQKRLEWHPKPLRVRLPAKRRR